MRFHPTSIAGAYVVELEPNVDPRGSFSRLFCRREFAAQGIEFVMAQANLAQTKHAGVVRGLHYLEKPGIEQKLVRCMAGAVYDALVDMRSESPSYRAVFHLRLDSSERKALFIPSGVAHGYQALEDDTEFMYLTDQFYTPGFEKGVRYDDPAIAVPWPLPPRDVTQRDSQWPLLSPPKMR